MTGMVGIVSFQLLQGTGCLEFSSRAFYMDISMWICSSKP